MYIVIYLIRMTVSPFITISINRMEDGIMNSDTLLVTHIDLDGSGCEVAVRYYYLLMYNKRIDSIRVNYDFDTDPQIINLIMKYPNVVFTDISFSAEYAKKLDTMMKLSKSIFGIQYTVKLFDHHKSSDERLTPLQYDWITIDQSRSGSKIAYDYYLSILPDNLKSQYSRLDYFIKLVNDYDLWKHEYKDSKLLQFLWSGSDKDEFVYRFVNDPDVTKLSMEEGEIINSSLRNYEESLSNSLESLEIYTDIEGNRFGICNKNNLYSLVGSKILKDNPDLAYLVMKDPLNISLSFRSSYYDVSKIAESLGGGGHALAAGASLPQFSDVVESVRTRQVVRLSFLTNFS